MQKGDLLAYTHNMRFKEVYPKEAYPIIIKINSQNVLVYDFANGYNYIEKKDLHLYTHIKNRADVNLFNYRRDSK